MIEDDKVLSAQLGELLRLQGDAVSLSLQGESGESGLAMALADTPDLILLDVMLPGVNAFSVFESIPDYEGVRGSYEPGRELRLGVALRF